MNFRMARILGIAAITALLMSVLLLVQWVTPFGVSDSFDITASKPVWQRRADNSNFLLGAGKADITGYVDTGI